MEQNTQWDKARVRDALTRHVLAALRREGLLPAALWQAAADDLERRKEGGAWN